ncbi:MAG: PocR ligand-binding domain-containing protein [Candidatus Omnitrophota bacterium]
MLQTDLRLKDVINADDWHKIQETLSEAFEVSLRTFSTDGTILSETTRESHMINEILPRTTKEYGCVRILLDKKFDSISDIRVETELKCPFGLDIVVIPITAIGIRVVAYIVLGPVILKGRKSISEYTKDAQEYGIRLEELMDAVIEINVFSYNKIKAITSVIQSVFSRIAQSGFDKKRLGEIAPEVIELDPVFSRYYEERILTALLNACTVATGADSGSVMILDKKTDTLYIKASSKMDQDVVKRTKVRMGDGIAGMAAATAESIVLPKDKDKARLSDKMKRTNIKSSLIVPFSKANTHDVYGVLNLNVVRKETEFSDKDILLVKEMVNMAGIALIPLKKATEVSEAL